MEDGKTPESLDDVEVTRRISAAKTIKELKDVINSLEIINSPQGILAPEYVVRRIDEVRTGQKGIEFVTKTYGIADKLTELLPNDSTYKKRVLARE